MLLSFWMEALKIFCHVWDMPPMLSPNVHVSGFSSPVCSHKTLSLPRRIRRREKLYLALKGYGTSCLLHYLSCGVDTSLPWSAVTHWILISVFWSDQLHFCVSPSFYFSLVPTPSPGTTQEAGDKNPIKGPGLGPPLLMLHPLHDSLFCLQRLLITRNNFM